MVSVTQVMPVHEYNDTPYSEVQQSKPKLKMILKNGFAYNKSGVLRIKYPCSIDDALYHALGGMLEIAALSTEGDSILGCIKASIVCGSSRASLAIVQQKAPEIIRHEGWDSEEETDICHIMLSVLYLTDTAVPVDDLIAHIVQ